MANFSLTVIALLITALALLYKYILYPTYLSPLSKIPNAHPTAPISPLWIIYQRYRFNNNRATHAAHEKLGPIVRLGPNEVSVNCVDGGIRTVYGGGWEKHDWYKFFGTYGVYSMFSMTDSKSHAARKRMMSNIYSKSFLQTSPGLKAISKDMVFKRFLPLMYDAAKTDSPVDVNSMSNAFTMDFITAYLYGLPSATNLTQDIQAREWWMWNYQCRKPFEFWHQEVPNLTKWLMRVGLSPIPKYSDEANRELEAWCLGMSEKADKYLGSATPGDEPAVYKQLKTNMDKQKAKQGDLEKNQKAGLEEKQKYEIAAEMYDQLTAGHETSAVALVYLQWEMAKHPDRQQKLREELLTLNPSIEFSVAKGGDMTLPDAKAIDALPYLNGIIMETLRLHTPIPGIQPRISPDTSTGKSTVLAGVTALPGNVRVNAQAWSLHRNDEVFPRSGEWIPERWLEVGGAEQSESGPNSLDEMKRWFWAFGSGGRMCVGSNLALQEMKLIVAAIYSNFETSVVDATDNAMEKLDAYTTKPMGGKCYLQFKHVK